MSPAIQAALVAVVVGAAAAYAIVAAVRAARGKRPSCCQSGTVPVDGCSTCHGCTGPGK